MRVSFSPSLEPVDAFHVASGRQIAEEPMIYGGSVDWCNENAGEITRSIIALISEPLAEDIESMALMGYHPVIDTKSVLLMPGQYPCIGGWHCDGVIRPDMHSQPNLETLNEPVAHYICVIQAGGGKATEFLNDSVVLDVDESRVWASVDEQLRAGDHKTYRANSGQVYRFQRDQLHRGNPAEERGWRYFFRLSFYHMPCMNQFRKQVQIYTDINGGW